MALITCEDCGREVSERAQSCPSCGCPTGGFQINTAASPGTYAPRNQVRTRPTPMWIKKGMLISAFLITTGGIGCFFSRRFDETFFLALIFLFIGAFLFLAVGLAALFQHDEP